MSMLFVNRYTEKATLGKKSPARGGKRPIPKLTKLSELAFLSKGGILLALV
ncbi:MAG: hypothetical protein KAW12_21145 [Candidatus Aminicenantes bacterium]|nr:hypothetical protein [Candidatus Aminicenantes bacterium]